MFSLPFYEFSKTYMEWKVVRMKVQVGVLLRICYRIIVKSQHSEICKTNSISFVEKREMTSEIFVYNFNEFLVGKLKE